MRKFLAVLLMMALALPLVSLAGETYELALVTDIGTINDKSFWTNQVGQGLFTSTYRENKDAFGNTWVEGNQSHQLEGTGQFSLQGLSAAARRARVIAT